MGIAQFQMVNVYHLESRWLATAMYWFIMATSPKPLFGSWAIYFHQSLP